MKRTVACCSTALGLGLVSILGGACTAERPELVAVDQSAIAQETDVGAIETTPSTEPATPAGASSTTKDTPTPTTAEATEVTTGARSRAADPPAADTLPGETPESETSTPAPAGRPAAPNGQVAPSVATDPLGLAAQIIEAEEGLRDPNATDEELAYYGHLQQVTYRKLGREDSWDFQVLDALPVELRNNVNLHVTARRALRGLHSGFPSADFIPAWGIVEPAPAEELLRFYNEASETTGIEWEFLAAINLLETGLGQIRGLSGAGAQGPMQFMPMTWEEVGEGDVNDPEDAIHAAARYLVRRGGPEDMPKALWGYNNSDEYVAAVSTYAQILRGDPQAFVGLYHWQIYFSTDAGDVWLPSGFASTETIDLLDYLASAPWSMPDPGLKASTPR